MFTGIVHSQREVIGIDLDRECGTIQIRLDGGLTERLEIGASVAINGVCLTASAIDGDLVSFDVIQSTIQKTNLLEVAGGDFVNVERSYVQGDEIGGHEVSGHVDTTARVVAIEAVRGNVHQTFALPPFWMRYIFLQGFIAINGASLTVSEVDKKEHCFSVWLIPETLRRTNLNKVSIGDYVNIEVHKGVQVVVDTVGDAVERVITQAIENERLSGELVRDLLGTTGNLLQGSSLNQSDYEE